jgi:hypothetical protein
MELPKFLHDGVVVGSEVEVGFLQGLELELELDGAGEIGYCQQDAGGNIRHSEGLHKGFSPSLSSRSSYRGRGIRVGGFSCVVQAEGIGTRREVRGDAVRIVVADHDGRFGEFFMVRDINSLREVVVDERVELPFEGSHDGLKVSLSCLDIVAPFVRSVAVAKYLRDARNGKDMVFHIKTAIVWLRKTFWARIAWLKAFSFA